jgi:hypothetical protein
MEDVLDLYEEPHDPAYPTVCLDEKPVVLHTQTRPPLPPTPGAVERRDYEYVRQGTADLFVLVEPLAGWRQVVVTERRTRRDFAECLRSMICPPGDGASWRWKRSAMRPERPVAGSSARRTRG